MKKALTDLNIDARNITPDTTSKSTYENALVLLPILSPINNQAIMPATPVLLVKRVAATFEKAGQVCRIGVDT